MSLEKLAKDVQKFIKESYDHHVEYKKEHEKLMKLKKDGILGQQGFRDKENELMDSINAAKEERSNNLKNDIEKVREIELKHIEETTESVTADTLAELELLSQLELTNDDVSRYINEYKRIPLALRKLKEISTEKQTLNEFPPDRKQYLNTILGRMETNIDRFRNMQYTEFTIKVEMYMDGAIRSIGEDVSAYRSL